MRKVIFMMHVSLDGLVAEPNGEMDWIGYSAALEKYGHALHETTDAAIYGRVTYQMMEGYFPLLLKDPSMGGEGDLNHAKWLDSATKIVFSKTLDSVQWKNTIVIHDNVKEEMLKIKQQPGKNLWLLGSPTLAQTFMRLGLIDEYWINVNPIILGKGKPLFAGLDQPLPLKLLETRIFDGTVALRYGLEDS